MKVRSKTVWRSNPRISSRSRPKIPIREILALVRALKKSPRSRGQLQKLTRVSYATFFRLLADAQHELGVIIQHDAERARYTLIDCGILNLRRL